MPVKTLQSKITLRIRRSRKLVYLRDDFSDLGSYSQVGRVLKQIVEDGLLVKVGHGIYAKTRPSSLNPAKRVLAAPGGFKQIAREVLNRLKIKWYPNNAEVAYNTGVSTQIPANAIVVVESRITRKICYERFCLKYIRRKKTANQ